MNVDAENFGEVYQYIRDHKLIQRCECIGIDLEFTGMKYDNRQRQKSQHFPWQKFWKMRDVVRKFNIIQLGLTFVVKQNDTLIAYPFNFYLFPRENALYEPVISLQISCVEFNNNNKMDWNRWIHHGITYIRLNEYQLNMIKVSNKQKTYEQYMNYMEAQGHQNTIRLIKKMHELSNDKPQIIDNVPLSDRYNIEKALKQYAQMHQILCSIKLIKNEQKDCQTIKIIITKISPQEKNKVRNQAVQKMYGFTLLFDEIWKQPNLVFIGHNCFYDLLFIHQSLIKPLSKYEEMKQQMSSNGRKFYDTKYYANAYFMKYCQNSISNTSLQKLYQFFTKKDNKLFLTCSKDCYYDLNKPVAHQAGFDSFLTIEIFYKLKSNYPDFECEGKINLTRSYFNINLHGKNDEVCPWMDVFCFSFQDSNQFISNEIIRQKRQDSKKKFKQLLIKYNIEQQIYINYGYKELFLELNYSNKRRQILQKLVKMAAENNIKDLHSLSYFIQNRRKPKAIY